jgi:hypothetical protein
MTCHVSSEIRARVVNRAASTIQSNWFRAALPNIQEALKAKAFVVDEEILFPQCSAGLCDVHGLLQAAPSQPNIIFFLIDDMRADALGCMGNKIVQTPNIDMLAQRGVVFRNAFVTTSICAISRASILTGQWERRHRIHDFVTGLSAAQWNETYPARLRAAGYRIGFIGSSASETHRKSPRKEHRSISGADFLAKVANSFLTKEIQPTRTPRRDSATRRLSSSTALLRRDLFVSPSALTLSMRAMARRANLNLMRVMKHYTAT